MGRILVRWKSDRNNLEILCHPICNRLYLFYYQLHALSIVFHENIFSFMRIMYSHSWEYIPYFISWEYLCLLYFMRIYSHFMRIYSLLYFMRIFMFNVFHENVFLLLVSNVYCLFDYHSYLSSALFHQNIHTVFHQNIHTVFHQNIHTVFHQNIHTVFHHQQYRLLCIWLPLISIICFISSEYSYCISSSTISFMHSTLPNLCHPNYVIWFNSIVCRNLNFLFQMQDFESYKWPKKSICAGLRAMVYPPPKNCHFASSFIFLQKIFYKKKKIQKECAGHHSSTF